MCGAYSITGSTLNIVFNSSQIVHAYSDFTKGYIEHDNCLRLDWGVHIPTTGILERLGVSYSEIHRSTSSNQARW